MTARVGRRLRGTERCAVLLASLMVSTLLIATAAAPPGGDWRERALAYADTQHMFGPFQVSAQSYSGSFVRFQFDQGTAEITDYTVVARSSSTAVFQLVAPSVAGVGSAGLNGSVFGFSSSALSILSFNNPTSGLVLKSVSANMYANFTLSPGIDASRNGQSLNLSAPNLNARLFVTGAATLGLVGFQAVAHLPPGTEAFFRANSVEGEGAVGSSGQTALADAAVGGILGLESFSIGFEGYTELSDMRYGGISCEGVNLTASGFTADIQVAQTQRELLALHLHKSVIAYDVDSSYRVELDGVGLQRMADIGEVASDVGTTPVYAMINGRNGSLMVLRIPEPGDYQLTFQRIVPPPVEQPLNQIQLLAIVAVVIVLLGAAATFMLRKKPA